MSVALVLTAVYLAIGFTLIVWLAREDARGRSVPTWASVGARAAIYGPPVLGFLYLVTIAGDWPFFLFVLVFFSIALLMLDGVLNTPSRPRE
jgi:hypothetical protein